MCRRSGGIQRIWVTTGIRDESYWEISSGLQEGDQVVVGGQNTMKANGPEGGNA